MRALVTGGAGFIGTRLHTVLLDAGHEVLIVDDLRFGHVMPLPMDMLHVVIDSLGSQAAADAIRDFEPTVVFHAAAIHHRPYTEAHPQESVRVNVDGSRWLLKVCDGLSELEAVIACSTAAVYGFEDEVITEDAPIAPRGVYGESKLRMERSMRRFSAAHPRVCVAAARLFNVYGPGNRTSHVMPTLMDQLWRSEPLRVGNTWPKRDYVHVYDVAEALVRLARWRPGFWAYNVGTGVGTSVGPAHRPARLDRRRLRRARVRSRAACASTTATSSAIRRGSSRAPAGGRASSSADGLAWLAQDTMATSATG